MTSRLPLVDEGDLDRCVQCGLCLPHCPTFRVSGDEAASPRGRIGAMRAAAAGEVALDDARLAEVIDSCVGCRGCETACPSGVPFGRLLEGTRAALAEAGARPPVMVAAGLWAVRRPRSLRLAGSVLAALQRIGLAPRRLGLPRLDLRRRSLPVTGADAWLFTGCVMDAWQRPVHHAAIRVLGAVGVGVEPTGDRAPCCGALHLHAGRHRQAVALAEATVGALSAGGDQRPVLVDSAGCGAALKDYGHLLGTDAARRFAGRVRDVHEVLAEHADRLPVDAERMVARAAVHDPCHLRHAQRVHHAVRQAVAPAVGELVELDDAGLCCGAGGAYAVAHPETAGAIRDRKLASIERSGAAVVLTANPGCEWHLRAGGVDARHPLEVIAAALDDDGRHDPQGGEHRGR